MSRVFATLPIAWERCRIWVTKGRDSGTYEWVVVGLPYIIGYEVDEVASEVAIVAVFHGALRR